MKRKLFLLLVGVCLTGVVWACLNSTIKKNSKFIETIRAVNVLNNDLVKTMGEKPTLETIGQAQVLLDRHSPLVREKIKELRDAGRLRKNSDERLNLDECIAKNTDKLADYYENFADSAQADLEDLNDLKDQYINVKFTAADASNLRKQIISKNDSLKENLDVIKAMEVLMSGLETIYKEVEMEDVENV